MGDNVNDGLVPSLFVGDLVVLVADGGGGGGG